MDAFRFNAYDSSRLCGIAEHRKFRLAYASQVWRQDLHTHQFCTLSSCCTGCSKSQSTACRCLYQAQSLAIQECCTSTYKNVLVCESYDEHTCTSALPLWCRDKPRITSAPYGNLHSLVPVLQAWTHRLLVISVSPAYTPMKVLVQLGHDRNQQTL